MATGYSGKIEYFKPITINETTVRIDYTCVPSLTDDIPVNVYYRKVGSSLYSKIEDINTKGNIISGLDPDTEYEFYLEIGVRGNPEYSGSVNKRGTFTTYDKDNDSTTVYRGTYTFTYSTKLWQVSFLLDDGDFILDDGTTYNLTTSYSEDTFKFAYGPQRYYSDSSITPPKSFEEPPVEENYNNEFIAVTPTGLSAGSIPSVTFELYNAKDTTRETMTISGTEISVQCVTSETKTATTWEKVSIDSISAFTIGDEVVISVNNPHNTVFSLELFLNDGSSIGPIEGYSGTEVKGFNSEENQKQQKESLNGAIGGEYYVRLVVKNEEYSFSYSDTSGKNNYWDTGSSSNPPTFSSDNITYYDSDDGNQKQIVSSITYDNQIIVQGQSYLVVKVAAAKASGGASIKRYEATFDKVSKSVEAKSGQSYVEFNFGNVSASHTQYVRVDAVDSNSQRTTAYKRIVIRPYKDPYVDLKAFRVEEDSDVSYLKIVPHRSSVIVRNSNVSGDVNKKLFKVKYTFVEKGMTLAEIKEKEITGDVEFKKLDEENYSRYILKRLDCTKKWTYVIKVEDAFHQDFTLAGKNNNAIYFVLDLQNKVYKKEVVTDENSRILEKIKRNIDTNFICPKFRISVLYPDETINYEIPLEDIKVGGTYSENYQNGQRRTLNFELYNEEGKYTPNINKFWAGTRLRLDLGIEYNTDEYYWFEKGVFVITSVQPSTVPGLKTVKVNAGDKYALFENNTGKLISAYEIDVNNDIEELIHEILFTNSGNGYPLDGKDFIYHSSFKGAKTQVKISKNAGDSYSSILSDLATQLSAEMFYDDHGRLNVMPLEEVTQDISKELLYNYDTGESGISSLDFNIDYTSIVNRIIVTSSPSSGGVYYAESVNDDASSPLCYQRIGYRTGDIINDNNIWSDELAKERADYELRKVLILKSTTTITVPFNPFLKVNNVISLSDEFYELKRTRFLLQSVSFNLDYSNQMSISFSNLNNLPFIVR